MSKTTFVLEGECVTLCFVQMFMSGNNDKVCKMLLKNRGYHFFNLFPMTV